MRISWKCSACLALSLASSVMVSPFLSFTGLEGALFFPDSVLVISYSLFMSLLPAAVSASSVRSCMKLLVRSGTFLDLSVLTPSTGPVDLASVAPNNLPHNNLN